MARRVFLPLTDRLRTELAEPSVTVMRQRLGGRVGARLATDVGPGTIVELRAGADFPQVGVLLCAEANTVDVYLERGIVKRTRPDQVAPHLGAPTPAQERISREVCAFEALREGQRVLVERGDGARVDGTLREKCRYGAVVETSAGRLLAVGFRRLWPLAERSAS